MAEELRMEVRDGIKWRINPDGTKTQMSEYSSKPEDLVYLAAWEGFIFTRGFHRFADFSGIYRVTEAGVDGTMGHRYGLEKIT